MQDGSTERNLNAGKGIYQPRNTLVGSLTLRIGHDYKKSIRIDDTLIPTILCVVGIFLSALISVGTAEPQNWMQWIILGAVSLGQGYVIAAAAICLNQLVKQHVKAGELKRGFDGDGEINEKDGENDEKRN